MLSVNATIKELTPTQPAAATPLVDASQTDAPRTNTAFRHNGEGALHRHKSPQSAQWAEVLAAETEIKARAERRAATFKVGYRFFHLQHGPGAVTELNEDGSITMHFESGSHHTYHLASQRKLKPIIEDAHALTPNALFDLVDTDSSGALDKDEFAFLHQIIVEGEARHAAKASAAKRAEEEQRKRANTLHRMLIAAALVIVLLLAGVGGLMAGITASFKDSYADHSSAATTTVLTDRSSTPIGTVEATVSVPMYAAPALPFEDLAQVKRLQLSYGSVEPKTKEMAAVTAVRQKNATSVTFDLGCSRSVLVLNGAAHLVDHALEVETPLCAANVSCSAFTARQEIVDEVLAKAEADLAAIGVDVTHASRRQLFHQEGCAADNAFTPSEPEHNRRGKNSILLGSGGNGLTLGECQQLCANSDACAAVSYRSLLSSTSRCRLYSASSPLQSGLAGLAWTTYSVIVDSSSQVPPQPPEPPPPPSPSPPAPEAPEYMIAGAYHDGTDGANNQADDPVDCDTGFLNAGTGCTGRRLAAAKAEDRLLAAAKAEERERAAGTNHDVAS